MSRTLTRAGLWASGPRQLTLPVEARGLSEVTISSGWLRITPDYDVLAWLCERWWERPTESEWMCPTFYEIGQDLYGRPAGGEEHRVMHEAIRRLAMVSVEVRGFNGETGRPDRTVVTYSHLLEATLPRDDPEGLNRLRVHLSGWLRALLEREALRFSWRTLRGFNSRQLLAKRLWLYLQAERWKRESEREATWVAVGDRLFAALGMAEGRPHRQCRASLKRACETVCRVDPRLGAGGVHLRQRGTSWQLVARRPTASAWEGARTERAEVRAKIAESLDR